MRSSLLRAHRPHGSGDSQLASCCRCCGTAHYVAPEILNGPRLGGYTSDGAVDMWSAGCIMFLLLSGGVPFDAGDDDLATFKLVRAGVYEMPEKYWGNVSEAAKALVRALLVVDPAQRLTAEQVSGASALVPQTLSASFAQCLPNGCRQWVEAAPLRVDKQSSKWHQSFTGN